jgi:hypothetical protein
MLYGLLGPIAAFYRANRWLIKIQILKFKLIYCKYFSVYHICFLFRQSVPGNLRAWLLLQIYREMNGRQSLFRLEASRSGIQLPPVSD